MTTQFTRWKNGLFVGSIAAVLEGLLLGLSDPNISTWDFLQSISFWLFCGFVVYLAETGLPVLPGSILLTILLNIPWYIALSIGDGKPGLLIPLVVASLIFGTVIGLVSKKLKQTS
jgi:hypothetical protein